MLLEKRVLLDIKSTATKLNVHNNFSMSLCINYKTKLWQTKGLAFARPFYLRWDNLLQV